MKWIRYFGYWIDIYQRGTTNENEIEPSFILRVLASYNISEETSYRRVEGDIIDLFGLLTPRNIDAHDQNFTSSKKLPPSNEIRM